MPKKVFSGADVIKILNKEFGFNVVSQKGSHVKLKRIIRDRNITTLCRFIKN